MLRARPGSYQQRLRVVITASELRPEQRLGQRQEPRHQQQELRREQLHQQQQEQQQEQQQQEPRLPFCRHRRRARAPERQRQERFSGSSVDTPKVQVW